MSGKTVDPLLVNIYDNYHTLIGTSFVGVYRGNWPLLVGQPPSQMTRSYDVVVLRFDPQEISSTISATMTLDHDNTYWKAVTGPDEGNPHGDYILWGTAPIKGAVPGQRQQYSITDVSLVMDAITHNNTAYVAGVEWTLQAMDLL